MKLISQQFEKDRSGKITLVPQDKEDLWTIYNLIQANQDEITLLTQRNVKKSNNTETKSSSNTTRKLVKLTLSIESIEFVPSDSNMRLKGRNLQQHDDVPLGSYHTASIEFNQKFTLYKPDWDEMSLQLINQSCSVDEKAEVGAVVLQDGVAHVCLLTDNMTVLKSKIEKSIPKKRRGDNGNGGYDKALKKFIEMSAESTIRNLDIVGKLKVVLLVSPGFTNRLLLDKIMDIATKENDKVLLQSKNKFLLAHSSTGYLQGLEEALKTPELVKRLSDTKFQQNVELFDEFSKLLNDDEGKAWYGEEEVKKAAALGGAIKYLLITDTLFKTDDIQKRKFYISLTEQVKNDGGEAVVFSSLHDSGEQLNQLTGIAIILNYPVPNLDDTDDEDDDDE